MKFTVHRWTRVHTTVAVLDLTDPQRRAVYKCGRRLGYRRAYKGGGWWHQLVLGGRATLVDNDVKGFKDMLARALMHGDLDLPAAKRRTTNLTVAERRVLANVERGLMNALGQAGYTDE